MIGIENIKLAINAVGSLSAAISALLNGGIGLDDLPAVQAAAADLFNLKDCDFSKLQDELKDLDASEQLEIGQLFALKFDLKDDSLESKIEKGVSVLLMAIPFLLSLLKK